MHNLDSSSQAMLEGNYRYKQWCNSEGECYLRPARWVILHDDISIPLDITLEGAVYRLTTTLNSTAPGIRHYNATVHQASESEFSKQNLTAQHDYMLSDYDKNGAKDLISNKDIYIAQADSETRTELLLSAEDLTNAATIANQRYRFYTDLASQLINVSQKVAELSGLYCDYANKLGGNLLDGTQANAVDRNKCTNDQKSSQAEHLNTQLTQSELAASVSSNAHTS